MALIPLKDDNPLRRIGFQYMTVALMAVCTAVFLWQLSLGGAEGQAVFGFGTIPSVLFGARELAPDLVMVPAPVTLLTSLFLHGGWMHLIGNMLFLWVFGDNVEDAMGHVRFLAFYLVCGVVAGLAHSVPARRLDGAPDRRQRRRLGGPWRLPGVAPEGAGAGPGLLLPRPPAGGRRPRRMDRAPVVQRLSWRRRGGRRHRLVGPHRRRRRGRTPGGSHAAPGGASFRRRRAARRGGPAEGRGKALAPPRLGAPGRLSGRPRHGAGVFPWGPDNPCGSIPGVVLVGPRVVQGIAVRLTDVETAMLSGEFGGALSNCHRAADRGRPLLRRRRLRRG